ncbi:MAG: nucleotidyltransferase domain-containing protein [Deferrisomatales bacterium]|nr:nucleotidyltransferase domain-containing protein [Deferrisomatales bacterium]
MVSEEIREVIQRFAAAVASRGVRVDKVLLFGSHAANRETGDSDLDVAIVSPDFGKDRFNEGKMLMQLAWRVDMRLHPVPLSRDSFAKDSWVPLIHEIRSCGIEIH